MKHRCFHFNAVDTVPKEVRELSDLFPIKCVDCDEIIRYDRGDHKPFGGTMDYNLTKEHEVKNAQIYMRRWI